MKIAVDAMGGDHGPAVVVEGAVAAVREFGSSVILVGDREAIEHEVGRLGAQSLGLEIRHASEIVGMADSPSLALPMKPLCREDCRGLCRVCGANRNTAPCTCDPRPPDPRLAALRDLATRHAN